uniref:Macrolide phosphotransferase n=1 Tax=Acinetobacter baumannii TaxID=470 RepID=A0A125S0V3_ACIBA|nr:macrolide phosphotransferase [Acinetobacter baumannii]
MKQLVDNIARKMTIQDIQSLTAEAHGLLLTDKMNFNEMILRSFNGCCVFLVVMA